MESTKNSKNSTILNDEINYNEIIDQGRKLVNGVNGENAKIGENYINLSLLAPNIDSQSKINAWAIKSFVRYKLKDDIVVLSFIKKSLKALNGIKLNSLEPNTVFCLIRIFYRAGILLSELNQIYLSCFCMYEAKNLFEEKDIRSERESRDTLDTQFANALKEVSKDVNKINIILVSCYF